MGGSTGGRRQAGLLRVARSALEVHRRGGSNGAKGLPGESLKVHGTLKVTLCCAHNTRCKHSDKPWFSWHPAAAEHGQNEQKNKCMVKTERQSMMQHRRMINTIQPEIFIFKRVTVSRGLTSVRTMSLNTKTVPNTWEPFWKDVIHWLTLIY